MSINEPSTAQVVADLVKSLHGATLTNVTDGTVTAPVLMTPKTGGGFAIESIKGHLDQYRSQPEHRTGTAVMTTIESFIEHVTRFADADSALFADRNPSKPSLLAVIDYHRIGDDGQPRFGRHRTSFSFPLSDEYKAWTKADNTAMDQSDFAAFVEDRVGDLIAPPDLRHDVDPADQHLADFATLVGGDFASPSKMVELSRGLAVHVNERVKQATNLSTGEIQVQFDSGHTDQSGAPLKVPNLFLIAIPVFEGGAPYRIPVRLRYRVKDGVIRWFYQLYRIDKVFKHAFDEACARAKAETKLPLLSGFPEDRSAG